jgi:hypothetical protein
MDAYTGPQTPWQNAQGQSLIPVVPVTARWEASPGRNCSRSQFPLAIAYGVTIHKSQGLTLERAVIDLGEREFATGLSFVAMSCVKTLQGLAFRSRFGIGRLQRAETPALAKLKADNTCREGLGFTLNTYGVDLSRYD